MSGAFVAKPFAQSASRTAIQSEMRIRDRGWTLIDLPNGEDFAASLVSTGGRFVETTRLWSASISETFPIELVLDQCERPRGSATNLHDDQANRDHNKMPDAATSMIFKAKDHLNYAVMDRSAFEMAAL